MMTKKTNTEHLKETTFIRSEDELFIFGNIKLKEIILEVWNKKLGLLIFNMTIALCSVFYALSIPNIYQSTALVKINDPNSNNSGLSNLPGQLGGIASLAGIDLEGNSNNTDFTVAVLKSKSFMVEFFSQEKVGFYLLALKGWDKTNDTLVVDSKVYDISSNKWVRDVSYPKKKEPTFLEVYEVFMTEHFSISEDIESGFFTIRFNHYSPTVAKNMLESIIKMINKQIKQRDLLEAESSISYLKKKLEGTNINSLKATFYHLIEKHNQTLMLANIKEDYALTIIDEPFTPEEKVGPKRAIICILLTVLGFIASTLFVVTKYLIRTGKTHD